MKTTLVVIAVALIASAMAGEVIVPKPPAPPPNPADGETKKAGPKIQDKELDPVVVAPAKTFPWVGRPAVAPKPPAKPDDKAPASPADNSLNLSGSDMIMYAQGPITREEKTVQTPTGPLVKEHLTMTEKVEIEMLEDKSVLRGETIVAVRDMKSNETELLDAKGNVELVSPGRTGKGEMLRFEKQRGPQGELLKSQFLLVGDTATSTKATLWMRKDPADPKQVDVIEAMRFVRDERLDTFQATGAPNAIITMGNDAPAAAAPAASGTKETKGGGSGFESMKMSGPGKVNIRCDAEMFFDGSTGKMKVTRNVVLIKEGLNPGEGALIRSDEAVITMALPPPGAAPNPAGAMVGEMQRLECTGRVEIKSGTNTILCDKMTLDVEPNIAVMEMKNPADTVLIYDYSHPSGADGGDVMIVPKTMRVHLNDNQMEPGGPMKRRTFAGPPPSNRGNGPKPEDVKPLPDKPPKSTDEKKAKSGAAKK